MLDLIPVRFRLHVISVRSTGSRRRGCKFLSSLSRRGSLCPPLLQAFAPFNASTSRLRPSTLSRIRHVYLTFFKFSVVFFFHLKKRGVLVLVVVASLPGRLI
jgi:hypothetical protein